MPKLAANLSFLFQEVSFLERFAAAAAAGFTGVEFLFPYDFTPAEIVEQLKDHGLSQALFNLPPGDWAKGDRGMAALPGRENEFLAGLERALEYAVATDCKRLHAMAGNLPAGGDRREGTAVYVSNLRAAAERAARYGVTLLIEPLNKRDNPGYFLNTTAEAMAILREVGRDNLKLQLDLYHCQITEGDLALHIRSLAGSYEHVQIAGVPDRHEPDHGEVNYGYLLGLLDEIGYPGGPAVNIARSPRRVRGWLGRSAGAFIRPEPGASSGID